MVGFRYSMSRDAYVLRFVGNRIGPVYAVGTTFLTSEKGLAAAPEPVPTEPDTIPTEPEPEPVAAEPEPEPEPVAVVVVVTRNSAVPLSALVEGVRAQLRKDHELVIVDDFSTDETAE